MYSGYMPYAPGAFPALILLTALYVSKTVGDGCHCPHLQWLLQLLLQEHLEGRVVGGLEGCKNALSTVTLQTPGWTAGFHRQPSVVLTALYFSVSVGEI